MAVSYSRKWWPTWLPFIGFRDELIRRDEARELDVEPVNGMNWALYNVFVVSWFGNGVILWAKGPFKLPADLPWDFNGNFTESDDEHDANR